MNTKKKKMVVAYIICIGLSTIPSILFLLMNCTTYFAKITESSIVDIYNLTEYDEEHYAYEYIYEGVFYNAVMKKKNVKTGYEIGEDKGYDVDGIREEEIYDNGYRKVKIYVE